MVTVQWWISVVSNEEEEEEEEGMHCYLLPSEIQKACAVVLWDSETLETQKACPPRWCSRLVQVNKGTASWTSAWLAGQGLVEMDKGAWRDGQGLVEMDKGEVTEGHDRSDKGLKNDKGLASDVKHLANRRTPGP